MTKEIIVYFIERNLNNTWLAFDLQDPDLQMTSDPNKAMVFETREMAESMLIIAEENQADWFVDFEPFTITEHIFT